MATCRECGQYLGDGHRCQGPRRRYRGAPAACAGALIAIVAPFLVSPGYHLHFASVLAAGALGALIAGALWRAVAK